MENQEQEEVIPASPEQVVEMVSGAQQAQEMTQEERAKALQETLANYREEAKKGTQPAISKEDSDLVADLIEKAQDICKKNHWPMAACAATFQPDPDAKEGEEVEAIQQSIFSLIFGSKASRLKSGLTDSRFGAIWSANAMTFGDVGLIPRNSVEENDQALEEIEALQEQVAPAGESGEQIAG